MRLLLIFAAAAPLFAQNLCPYGIAPSQPFTIPAVSYTSQIYVSAGSDCTWTYSTDSPWITFAPPSVTTGSSTLGWSASANVTPYSRQANIKVTGAGAAGNALTLTINQTGAVCAITLPQPPSASIGVSGGSGTFQVHANCNWSAASSSGWITVPPNTGGTGNGTVNYTVAASGCATARSGAIPVTSYTASQQFQINQDGSPGNFAVSPASVTIPPAGVAGGILNVATGDGCPWSATVDVSWITLLSGRSGAGPGGFGYSVPANTGPQRAGHITGLPGPWVVTVTQQALPPPVMQLNAVVNAASNVGSAVSPGEIVTLYGANIGPATAAGFQVNADGTYAKSLGGTRVLFDGVPAGVIYASASQVNAVAPYGLASGTTTQVQVEYAGLRSQPVAIPVGPAAPGIYCYSGGAGQAVAVNTYADQTVAYNQDRPAARGGYLTFFITGEGQLTAPWADGFLPVAPLFPNPAAPVSVHMGGVPSECSGNWEGLIYEGVTQVNACVPAGAPTGDAVPLEVSVGGVSAQSGVTVRIGS